ncbi:MAG: hypothetical protein IPN85_15210 [Flavobacteriales bacterium]|nr:hypothetical protein [Flavobacteriales bacterium]MBK9286405.1 hypothetical protein [Flavobacteriales bacterium]MBL0034776.1 hypothetical protein [Flavobacteriales bacterium]
MLLIHVEHPSTRSTYVIRHVFERMLGIPFRMVEDRAAFLAEQGPRLIYGTAPVEGALHVPFSGVLNRPPAGDPTLGQLNGMPVLYPVSNGFDLFAATFFLLALVDEERCTARDMHDRIPADDLFVVRAGLADEPWLDRWALDLHRRLRERWPELASAHRRYTHTATVDMDNVLRYAGRPLLRAIGASLKDLCALRFGAVVERWLVRSGMRRDPYVQAIELVQQHAPVLGRPILFFLTKGDGMHDHAAVRWPRYFRQLLDGPLGVEGLRYGIHPSYRSSEDERAHFKQVFAFEMDMRVPRDASRQHFLRWRLPGTLRHVATMGFKEEHSLGFSERPGFRASTCTPFPWYDLEREEETKLMLWPFAVMDSALIEHMGMGPDEVVRTMNAISDAVRAVSGTFVSVWHDRYLSGHREFAPWPAVFEQVVQHAKA